MKKSIKNYLKTLLRIVAAGLITNILYIFGNVIVRAVVNDFSEKMTVTRSLLYLLAMLGLQIIYCFILISFRYGASGEGIRQLTEDCKTEPYSGIWNDLKKLIRKEKSILFTALAIITLCPFLIIMNIGLPLTQLFIGIAGVSIFIPDLFLFLLTVNPMHADFGMVIMFCIDGVFIGFVLFSIIYLGMLSWKRKKWYNEWKIQCL